jgi:glycosyltransferase involved in cell wall biosynthesis
MASRAPETSICIPTRNRAHYLRAALESALGQTYRDFEIVVCDDASEDGTELLFHSPADRRIRYFRHANRLGIAANRNSCLAMARGRYIAWLDSDDVYLPEMLARQTSTLDRHPNVGLVHGGFHVIGAEGQVLPDWPLPFPNDAIESGSSAFAELSLRNYITAPTVVVRREAQNRAGLYATTLGATGTDWDMWLRLALHADIAYTVAPVARYRHHPGSISIEADANGMRLIADVAVIRHVFSASRDAIPDVERLERRALAALGARALRASAEAAARRDTNAALQHAQLALELLPDGIAGTDGAALLGDIHDANDFGGHRLIKTLLGRVLEEFDGTRFARRFTKTSRFDASWETTLGAIAGVVQRVVPADAAVATVDKWDPTILHLSGRQGTHFPDLALLPGGYPSDSQAAIDHLEYLRSRGIGFLVFSQATFWWLQHYSGLREHLDTRYRRAWRDEHCVIYQLSR